MIIVPPVWNRKVVENHWTILLRQSFGSTEPLGTAPNINHLVVLTLLALRQISINNTNSW